MTEAGAATAAASRPAALEIRNTALAVAGYSLVVAAFDIFVGSGNGGVVGLAIVALLVGVATAGVFGWAVPWALGMEEPGPSVVGLVSSGLGLLTVVIFWSGLSPVFAGAGILLGRSQRTAYEGRSFATAAVWLGAASLVLYAIRIVVDVV